MVKFNKDYKDIVLKRDVKANEEVEMTVKRADELVETIRAQSKKFKGYEDFDYERTDQDVKEVENEDVKKEVEDKPIEKKTK